MWSAPGEPDDGAMSKPSATPQTKQATAQLVVALNVESGAAPEWVELIPAGEKVQGRDGREWLNDRPADVVVTTADRLPLVLDWEHATEEKAPKGEEAPAAAWIEEVEAREGGAIWGRVVWNERARNQVSGKEYRFLSPVFDFDRNTRRIARLISAGLTNTPNLYLTALNREGATDITREKETPLDLATRLREALGLAADATDDAIVAAVNTARAANRSVDLTQFAPRADLETAVNRANTVTAERDALLKEKTDAEIETAINGAMAEGKIAPASADHYRALCRREGGLADFQALAATLSPLAGAATSRAAAKVETSADKSQLTDEERAVCRAMGQSEADFLAAKKSGA